MKKNTFLTAVLLATIALPIYAEKQHKDHDSKSIKVIVRTDDDKNLEQLKVDGKIIDIETLKSFVEDHKGMKNHVDGEQKFKVMILNDDDIKTSAHSKKAHKKVKLSEGGKETIEVFVDTDGDKTTEKVIVNGKELSKEELEKFKSSGKMKVLHLDKGMKSGNKTKTIFINSNDTDQAVDVDVIVDQLSDLEQMDGERIIVKTIEGDAGHAKHVFKKRLKFKGSKEASLGFMANIKEDGWHLAEVVEGSGAADAGIKTGDVVKSIAEVSLEKPTGSEGSSIDVIPKFSEGDMVEIVVERDGRTLDFVVEARDLNDKEFAFNWSDNNTNTEVFKWLDDNDDADLLSKIKVMVFDGDENDFKLIEDDINMVFPKNLSDMNIFISDGNSTSKLLGKSHEMSSLSEGLSKYFHTTGGVLVLHVDKNNVFSLQDGDVIKSVNGENVVSPKEVVKALVLADKQENIELSVIRNKRSKLLKYDK